MTPLDQCIADTAKELGISDKDAREIAERLKKFQAKRQAEGRLDTLESDLRGFAKTEAEKTRIAAAAKKRQAAIAVLRRDEWDQDIGTMLAAGETPEYAIVAKLAGIYTTYVPLGRDSASARRKALEKDYIEGMGLDLQKQVPHFFKLLRSPTAAKPLLNDVLREMTEIGEGGKPGKTGNKDARTIADILYKYAEAARLEHNQAGGTIGQRPRWGGPQTHDAAKLLKAKREPWINAILPGLDLDESFGPETSRAEAVDRLGDIWDNIVSGGDQRWPEQGEKRLGPANLASSMSKERVLHFKDAEARIAYNEAFGKGNVVTAMVDHLHHMARATSLMQKMTANPEAFLEGVLEQLRQKGRGRGGGDIEQAAEDQQRLRIRKGVGGLTTIGKAFAEIRGDTFAPLHMSGAKISANVRSLNRMSDLGGVLFSSITDVPNMAHRLRVHGQPVLKALSNAGKVLFSGPRGPEAARIFDAGISTMLGDIHSRFGAEDHMGGKIAVAENWFFKLSGLTWWTDRLTTGFQSMISVDMAMKAAKGWDQLDEPYKRILAIHAITPERWEVLRKAVTQEDDGHGYILPGTVADLPDEAFNDLVAGALNGIDARLSERVAKRQQQDTQEAEWVAKRQAKFAERFARSRDYLESVRGKMDEAGQKRTDALRDRIDLMAGDLSEIAEAYAAVGDTRGRARRAGFDQGKLTERSRNLAKEMKAIDREVLARQKELGQPYLKAWKRWQDDLESFTARIEDRQKMRAEMDAKDTAAKPERIAAVYAKARRELELDLRAYYADEATFGVIHADDRTRMAMTQGTAPGTKLGEVMRFMMQYKAFPIAYAQKVLIPAMRGAGWKTNQRDYGGLAMLIATTTIFGYMAGMAKDAIKNREPKDIGNVNTWVAAFIQGGGAGLYGDFLFSKVNRFGGGFVDSAAGPTAGTVGQLQLLWSMAIRGEAKKSDAFKVFLDNFPGLNLFWLRAGLDFLILNQMQEILTPGTLRRREQKLKEEFGQERIFDPTPLVN
jgi:hypothetical protein